MLWSRFPHLDDIDRMMVGELVRALGGSLVGSILELPPDQHKTAIQSFKSYMDRTADDMRNQGRRGAEEPLAAARKELQAAQEELHSLRSELHSAQLDLARLRAERDGLRSVVAAIPQAQPRISPAPIKQKAIRIDVPKFDGTDGTKLVHWLLAVERGAEAQLIETPSHFVSYALSNLRGRAQEWAYALLLLDADCFPDWETFKARIRETYMPPNNETLLHQKFFSCRQERRPLLQYVQEMRTIAASCVQNPISEPLKVSGFIEGLNHGNVRQQLFRDIPSTLEEAIRIALIEDQSYHSSRQRAPTKSGGSSGSGNARSGGNGPAPMDLGNTEMVCQICNKRGHIASRCFQRFRNNPSPAGSRSFKDVKGRRSSLASTTSSSAPSAAGNSPPNQEQGNAQP